MKKYQLALVGGIVLLIGQIIVLLLPLRPQTGPVGEPHGLNWPGFFRGLSVVLPIIAIGLVGWKNEKRK
ncbi:hypothetical protein [Paenibacillus sp. UNC496MF]|uniref:hypothetical protein n=1 Tax=Paenibacillus sp. UNC496MF TaxID=1502753 RepID=UPI000B82CCA7|nr:hypothetical protein [Paenibacillus sp. UNC496MF]